MVNMLEYEAVDGKFALQHPILLNCSLFFARFAALYTWSALREDVDTIWPFWYAAGWRGVMWAIWVVRELLAAP